MLNILKMSCLVEIQLYFFLVSITLCCSWVSAILNYNSFTDSGFVPFNKYLKHQCQILKWHTVSTEEEYKAAQAAEKTNIMNHINATNKTIYMNSNIDSKYVFQPCHYICYTKSQPMAQHRFMVHS